MKKLIVFGIVTVMVMGLALSANAFTKDTDWLVYMQAGNNTWSSMTNNWGNAGTDIKLGHATTPGTVNGAAYVSTSGTVRDLSATGGGYGLTTNTVLALDQTGADQVQTWDDIELWAGSGYTNAALQLRIWGIGIDADGPALKLVVTQAKAGSGFAVGDIVFDSLAVGSKHYPTLAIDLSSSIAVLKTGTAEAPAVTFRLTATTPGIPEPGSMLAMLSGLIGLVGFGIRRRK